MGDLIFKKVSEDDRRTIWVNDGILPDKKEVSLIKLNKNKAVGGCLHELDNERFTILKGKVKIVGRFGSLDAFDIEGGGFSGIFLQNVSHAFFALEDSWIMEWGVRADDKGKHNESLRKIVNDFNTPS